MKNRTKNEQAQKMDIIAFAIDPTDKEHIEGLAKKADRTFAAQCRRMLRCVLADKKLCAAV